jgi:hypothetical protein
MYQHVAVVVIKVAASVLMGIVNLHPYKLFHRHNQKRIKEEVFLEVASSVDDRPLVVNNNSLLLGEEL